MKKAHLEKSTGKSAATEPEEEDSTEVKDPNLRTILLAIFLAIPILMIGACAFGFGGPENGRGNVYIKTSLHCLYAFGVGWINCVMALRFQVFATMMVGNIVMM